MRQATTNGPTPGVTILLGGTRFSAATNGQGSLPINWLSAGTDTLHAVVIGYSSDSLPGLRLAEGEHRTVDITLHRVPLMLQDIVVTASRTAERGDESTVSVAALPIRDIVQRDVTTLDQALVYVPGVTFNGNGQLDIRGAAGLARGSATARRSSSGSLRRFFPSTNTISPRPRPERGPSASQTIETMCP